MKLPINENIKAKLQSLARTVSDQMRVAGPPTVHWISNHKAMVVIIVLLLYILIPHSSAPQIRGPSITATVVAPSGSPPAATEPTSQPTTQAVNKQYAGDIPLYAPGVQGADPQWSLPAELSNADIQPFIQQVNTLANNYALATNLENRYEQIVSRLNEEKPFTIYWNRVIGPGFRDTALPIDWYQLVKDQPIGMVETTMAIEERLATAAVVEAVNTRLRTTQMRLVGGKLLVGDELFVKSLQMYVDAKLARFKQLTPLAESVLARQQKEFAKELSPSQDSGNGN